jgi:hypothetical protein
MHSILHFLLRRLSFLHSFGQSSQIAGSNLHSLKSSRAGVENALFLNIHLKSSARMAHGVAPGVPVTSRFACFNTNA